MGFLVNSTGDNIPFRDYSLLRGKIDLSTYSAIEQILEAWYNPEVDDIEFTSSGSTGIPKKLNHSKASIRKSIENTADYFRFEKGDRTLLALPLEFVAGAMMLLRSVECELDLILDKISSKPLGNVDYSIDFLAITPMQFSNCIKFFPIKLQSITKILLGGSPIPGSLFRHFQNWPGELYVGYGMTETLTHVAIRRLDGSVADSYYTAVSDDIRFSIDSQSCLVIETDFLPEPVHTNDVVELLDNKRFMWKGRRDFVINSGGLKIQAEYLENHFSAELSNHLIIFPIQDQILGQRPALAIESACTEELLLKLKELNSQLAHKFQVNTVFFLENFNYTPNGKIERKATQAALKGATSQNLK